MQAIADKPEGKLSFRLQLLVQPAIGVQDNETQAQILSLPANGPGSLLRNEHGELLVYIRLTDVSAPHVQTLKDTGANIVHIAEEYKIITAYIRIDRLLSVAGLAAVQSVQEELKPLTSATNLNRQDIERFAPAHPQAQADCISAITSEGDTQLNAAAARTAFGLNGAGVIVGVLSDTYARVAAPVSAANDIASGDLPGPANPCGRLTPINVIAEGPAAGSTDEGRAMLQIVHDLAPGANLAFATAFNGLFDFADQIRALRNVAGANIIVDDVSYFVEPFFQDGPVSVAIQDVTAAGALYFTSAGNSHKVDISGNAITSYEVSTYRPIACPPIGLTGTCHDFNPGAGTDNTQRLTLSNGGSIRLAFQWAEPWSGVQTDLDIYLLNASNTILAQSIDINPGGSQTPFEFFNYTNNTGSSQQVFLIINRFSGTATPRIKY
ncbi:MAG: hypothetical protein HYR94_12010, partial [Chloroflexi bacterium]|nr:hypothetical protein [Chloroflexota bacterium]